MSSGPILAVFSPIILSLAIQLLLCVTLLSTQISNLSRFAGDNINDRHVEFTLERHQLRREPSIKASPTVVSWEEPKGPPALTTPAVLGRVKRYYIAITLRNLMRVDNKDLSPSYRSASKAS